jgi:lysophospholipase L1-like esterase
MKARKLLAGGAALAAAVGLGTLIAPAQAAAEDATIVYAWAGDSLTSRGDSWLKASWDDETLVSTGGFASSGYTSEQVLANITAQPDADVLVIMLGTNDVRYGVSPAETAANFDKIVAKVGAPHVLVTFVPPSNLSLDRRVDHYVMNRVLTQHAAKRGWTIDDPWSHHRASTGAWVDGTSSDGTHPTAATSQFVEDRMEVYIRQAVEGSR